jgi:AcrR family transcriptional regulator
LTADRDQLTRAGILDAALALVDEEGFAALTMRNLAGRLGVVPMALYRHVANKADLVGAVLDAASARVTMPSTELEWRIGLTELAAAIRSELLEHPGLVAPLVNSPSLGPSALAIAEYGYSVMAPAGFEHDDLERGVNAIVAYTLGFVALEVPRRYPVNGTAPPDLDDLDEAYDAIDLDDFPHTISIKPVAKELITEEQFRYGLDRLLDGLQHRLRAARPEPRQRRR